MANLRLRLPEDVKVWIEAEAARTQRSQNGLIIWILRENMAAQAVDQREPAGALSPNIPPAGRINTGRTG